MRQNILLGRKSEDEMDVLFNDVSYELTVLKAREIITSGKCPYFMLVIFTKHGIKKIFRNHDIAEAMAAPSVVAHGITHNAVKQGTGGNGYKK